MSSTSPPGLKDHVGGQEERWAVTDVSHAEISVRKWLRLSLFLTKEQQVELKEELDVWPVLHLILKPSGPLNSKFKTI